MPGYGDHRECRTTASVAVQLCQHDTGDPDALVEGLGNVYRILTEHGIDYEQHFVGIDRISNLSCLTHQLLVDAKPAGRVNDYHRVLRSLRLLDGGFRYPNWVSNPITRLGCKNGHCGSLAENLKLSNGIWALQVCGYQHRSMPLALEPKRELSGESRLSGPLQAGQHNYSRCGFCKRKFALLAT